MYVIKGYGRNKVLYKISTNGEKRVFLCSRVSKFVKYTSGYLYYVDVNSALHVVRNDGTNDKVLVEGVDEKRVIIDEDYIYYLRYENVNSRKKNYSLYRAKHDGSDTKKLAFDVLGIMPYDENTIYISKSELVTYEVKTPISKKEVSTEIQTYNIKNYYSFDKDSCKFNLILSLGNPKAHEFEFKGGCLRKTKKLNSTYKQIPNKAEYKRGGKAEAGANFKEEQNVLLTQNMGNNTTKKNKVVNNAKKGINGGCGCLKRS